MEETQLKNNIKNSNQWIRIAQMILFVIILYITMMVVGGVILIQVLFALITGSDNQNLRQFAVDVTRYVNQILLFLTYNTSDKPFPFKGWGEEVSQSESVGKVIDGEAVVEDSDSKTEEK